jgi:hypothetical protein
VAAGNPLALAEADIGSYLRNRRDRLAGFDVPFPGAFPAGSQRWICILSVTLLASLFAEPGFARQFHWA